jgi:glycosyltransferase involved in cell wall biosynthesis
VLDVSVVIPAYNAEEFIGEQLNTILNSSTSTTFEVIVADNGSSDGTRRIVTDFADAHPNVSLIDASAVRGPSHARNVGASAASGRIIAFCDADDQVGERWIDEISKAVSPGTIVTGPLVINQINHGPAMGWRPPRVSTQLSVAFSFLPYAPSSNLGMTRSDFEHVGGFDENYPRSQDVEFSWRAQLAGLVLEFHPQVQVHYRHRSTVSGVLTQSIKSGRAAAQLFAAYREHGLTASSWRSVMQNLWWLGTRIPFLIDRRRRGVWARRFGETIGRIDGSVRFRVLYL